MMKYIVAVLAILGVASAQILLSGLGLPTALSGPSYHSPFAASADTGIRRYGFTGGFYSAAYAPALLYR